MSKTSAELAFCTTREAAGILGVSIGTVQQWAESGLLESWKTGGGHRRIQRDSVEKLLRHGSGASAPRPAPAGLAQSAAQRPCVMVVEDDASLRRLYETRLSFWPSRPKVLSIDNAVAALLRIVRESPQLLILDLNLHGMDGFHLIRCLKSAPEVQRTRIVAVSGLDPAEIEARGGLPADVALLPKPIPFDRLTSIWAELLASEGAPEAAQAVGPSLSTPR